MENERHWGRPVDLLVMPDGSAADLGRPGRRGLPRHLRSRRYRLVRRNRLPSLSSGSRFVRGRLVAAVWFAAQHSRSCPMPAAGSPGITDDAPRHRELRPSKRAGGVHSAAARELGVGGEQNRGLAARCSRCAGPQHVYARARLARDFLDNVERHHLARDLGESLHAADHREHIRYR